MGAGIGLLLISAVAVELRTVLTLVADGSWWPPLRRVLGYAVGGVATGMVLARLVALGQ